MSIYRRSPESIRRTLETFPEDQRAEARLALDFASLLVGPTCGGEAEDLTTKLLAASSHKELAERMQEAATRYLDVLHGARPWSTLEPTSAPIAVKKPSDPKKKAVIVLLLRISDGKPHRSSQATYEAAVYAGLVEYTNNHRWVLTEKGKEWLELDGKV